jgi:hypothetical protein
MDLEGSGCGIFVVLSWYSWGERKNINQDSNWNISNVVFELLALCFIFGRRGLQITAWRARCTD